jgi:hypothetical protein
MLHGDETIENAKGKESAEQKLDFERKVGFRNIGTASTKMP